MMSEALLPCPFCGGTAAVGVYGMSEKILGISQDNNKSRWFYRVSCLDCGVLQSAERFHIPTETKISGLCKDDSAVLAITAWNNRAHTDTRRVAELKAALEVFSECADEYNSEEGDWLDGHFAPPVWARALRRRGDDR
jgi:Lar family restriction alleviation protein